MRRLLLAALCLGQAGCSLTGLSDFAIFECSTHAECEPLNERRGIASDACVRYQCAADSHCRLQPIDLDRDGHATVACADSSECGAEIPCDDCDDTAATSFPGLEEVCDGVDNDCNLVVDDLASGGSSAMATTVVSGTDGPIFHGYGAPLPGTAVAPVSFGRLGATYFNVIDRDEVAAQALTTVGANIDQVSNDMIMNGCPTDQITVPVRTRPVGVTTETTCQTHDDCDNGVLCDGFEVCDPEADDADPVTGCAVEAVCAGAVCNEERGVCELGSLGVQGACSIEDMVSAEYEPGLWFGLAVQVSGCGGLVRAGYFTENQREGNDPGRNLLLRGDYRRSTSYRGIDPVSEPTNCTGQSRPEGEPLGAHLLAMAALPHDRAGGRVRPQALAAWLVPVEAGGQPIEVIGLWEEQLTVGDNAVRWVNATGNGVPQRLDKPAVGDARPALVSWVGQSAAGYVVAYGVSGGGIALRFIGAFADPPMVNATGFNTPIGPGAPDEPRTTPPIADLGSGSEVTISTNGDARQVRLALGRTEGDSVQLALAWHDDDGVRFATVELDGAAASFTAGSPQSVASGAADEIALGYAPSAVVLPGFERDGDVADASSSGGYLIAWRSGGTVNGARFAELDGQRVAPDVMRLGGDLRRLHVYVGATPNDAGSARDVPRLIYHDGAASEFRVTGAFCGPAN